MKIRFSRRGALVGLALAVLIAAGFVLAGRQRMGAADGLPRHGREAPRVMLWAWERPEELRGIDPREVGIAFLAQTLFLKADRVVTRPRLQPLSLPDNTYLMAVTRLETDRAARPALSAQQRERIVASIIALTEKPAVAALQVDFDAKVSERAFYRELLTDLRRRLPAGIGLSMTALASWCIHDDWLTDLPVDEVVPMLFRMGADRRQVMLHLEAGGDFRAPVSRRSLGLATDEPMPRLPAGRRIYVFNTRAWTTEGARSTIDEVKRWR